MGLGPPKSPAPIRHWEFHFPLGSGGKKDKLTHESHTIYTRSPASFADRVFSQITTHYIYIASIIL